MEKKNAVLRLDISNYQYIRKLSIATNRTISGQANLILKLVQYFQKNHSDLYFEIIRKLEKVAELDMNKNS
jgi:hypothetical protein